MKKQSFELHDQVFSALKVITIESGAFHLLLDHVVDYVKEKINHEDELLSTEGVANLLGVTPTSVNRYRKEGKISPLNPFSEGKAFYLKSAILESLANDGKRGGKSDK